MRKDLKRTAGALGLAFAVASNAQATVQNFSCGGGYVTDMIVDMQFFASGGTYKAVQPNIAFVLDNQSQQPDSTAKFENYVGKKWIIIWDADKETGKNNENWYYPLFQAVQSAYLSGSAITIFGTNLTAKDCSDLRYNAVGIALCADVNSATCSTPPSQ